MGGHPFSSPECPDSFCYSGDRDVQANLYPVVAALEDVSLLIAGLEADEGSWAWLRARSGIFGRLDDTIALTDLKKLIAWGCIEVNLIMLSLICTKAEVEEESIAIKLERVNSGVASYRRLKALRVWMICCLSRQSYSSPRSLIRPAYLMSLRSH
jgi:hypothetical protein